MKRRLIFGSLFVLLIIAIFFLLQKSRMSKVEFKDEAFYFAFSIHYFMPQYIDNSEGLEKMIPTKKELKNMQSLRLDFSELKTYELHDLDKFPNLNSLYIRAQTITKEQINYLAQMEQLEILILEINDKSLNYDALKNLKNLKQLVISGCNDTTVQFVSQLPQLELFGLYESEITNLDFLNSQKSLKSLGLKFVDIETITFVETLDNLEEFVAFGVNIKEGSDILLDAINPKQLSLQYCDFIKNIDFLKNMSNLEDITLYEIKITDISIFLEMEYFPKLRRVILSPELEKENLLIMEEIDPILKERQDIYLSKKKEYIEMEQWERPVGVKFPATIEKMKEYGVYLE